MMPCNRQRREGPSGLGGGAATPLLASLATSLRRWAPS